MEPLQTLAPSCRAASPLAPRSLSSSGRKTSSVLASPRSGRENIPPSHPNVHIDRSSSTLVSKKKQRVAPIVGENPAFHGPNDGSVPPTDDSVKVIVRIKPDQLKGGSRIFQRITSDTLSIGDQTYSFDSILDSGSSQVDVFNLIGVPLVKNSLAGFNNSVVSYGQSGAGKTYTMWGPPGAMVDGSCINSSQGIVPRIFQMLFSEINKKGENSAGVQTNYQCRCSFLEIYNEQINDLLDPTHRNLLTRDEAKHSFQVESLSEEYVSTIDDVTQLLVKGLSSNYFSSSKTSRISFVDLAGIGDNDLDAVSRQTIQEDWFIKKSLSKLGRLVSILSDSTHQENKEKVPLLDSCLNNVLQDTLGGNAKATFICSISPDERYKAITLSTLRFGGRVKQIKNKAMINEISEDDVNGLSDQIRQLKEELIRAKSFGGSCFVSTNGHFKRLANRNSLNILRRSLNHSLFLPSIDNDPEVDMDVDEKDIKELCVQLNDLDSSIEEQEKIFRKVSVSALSSDCMHDIELDSSGSQSGTKTDQTPNFSSFPVSNELNQEYSEESKVEKPNTLKIMPIESNEVQCNSENSSISKKSPLLKEPVLCASPKVDDSLKKSSLSSPCLLMKNISSESPKPGSEKGTFSKAVDPIRSSLQSSKVNPIESLAASLHRGLQIIDYHQRNSASSKSPVALSLEHLSLTSQSGMKKVDACGQTPPRDVNAPFLCSNCQKQATANGKFNMDMQINEGNNYGPSKEINKVLEGEIKASEDVKQRNTELETLCVEQAEKIRKLDSQNNEYVADHGINSGCIDKEALIEEIELLRKQLKSYNCSSTNVSLLEQIRNGSGTPVKGEEFEREKERWMESESRWISLTEELRIDLESNRRLAEKKELELSFEKQCTAELDDALHRSIQGHARIIEHYAELQEKYDELLGKHRKVMEAIAGVKKAAAKAESKCKGSAFAAALAAELATSKIEREKERSGLKEQNRVLKLQLRDTADAVHAAGELLVRLKESEEAVLITEEKYGKAQQEIEKLRRQIEKLKKKHTMEIATMKHYLAESRLPESALEPLYQHNSYSADPSRAPLSDDMSWRSAFKPSYQ
ncbi:kinesin-like protein KIN-12C isoform X2 [Phalaenopsis equestris]|uniref:kinesin-like protein KIN-12C isoform X2 n=1 Tax=Phalaenopsis equestris TaxID=78828 RepID=UPI0009E38E09|nr:kinesin-like protein KIN-12C isoform X2 [Phalaenopsis equestris]